MSIRVVVALLVLLGVTAFAPAPLPRRGRAPQPELSLKQMQGTWRINGIYWTRPDGRHVLETGGGTRVGIRDDRWAWLPGRNKGTDLDVSIDHTKTPPQVTFYRVGDKERKTYGVGLLRRRGQEVQLLYTWGGEDRRPNTFDPTPGDYWLMTLEREK